MYLIKVVTYASVMTKMHLGSSPDPLGPKVTQGGALGVIPKVDQMKKMLLIKVVAYASHIVRQQINMIEKCDLSYLAIILSEILIETQNQF